MDLLSVSDAASELSKLLGEPISARKLTEDFYRGRLPSDGHPIVGGRRLIPRNSLPALADLLANQMGSSKLEGRNAS